MISGPKRYWRIESAWEGEVQKKNPGGKGKGVYARTVAPLISREEIQKKKNKNPQTGRGKG